MANLNELIELFLQRCEQREKRLRGFLRGDGPDFLVVQHPPGTIWEACNSVKQVTENNVDYFSKCVRFDWTDDIPYLTPWVGTGVYANAFGCDYVFRDAAAPCVRYRYHRIDELRDIEYPDYRKSPIMTMVLDCIDSLKERTLGKLPIALTDTQSPYDTATLILDASELFAACYENEELVHDFMRKITDLIIEFSRIQIDRIGPELTARPGHQFPSIIGGPGLSVSDDNLAVSSPGINRKVAVPYDRQLGDAFDGVAVHSCGVWTHTMPMLAEIPNVIGIECAVGDGEGEGQEHGLHDPTPNAAADVARALAGSGTFAKVRLGQNIDKALAAIDQLVDPQLRLIVEMGYDEQNAQRHYELIRDKLERFYGQ
ncbi:MAG: hypothetical protein JW888_13905 [Pirellulales bacterium]|nr:hypothetical protein [Pirellulales bacterium]